MEYTCLLLKRRCRVEYLMQEMSFSNCGLQASADVQGDHRVVTLTVPNSSICTKLYTCNSQF